MGCDGLDGCTGYELVSDLDFDTNGSGAPDEGDEYWNDGRGWAPIGQSSGFGFHEDASFRATFDGSGHVISNLFIDRPDESVSACLGSL